MIEYAKTQVVLSKKIGWSERAISQMLNKEGLTRPPPDKTKKGWPVAEFKLWMKEQYEEIQKRVGRGNGTWTPMHDARLDRLRIEIDQLRMRMEQKRGELIRLEDAQEAVNFMGYQFRRAVELIPDEVARVQKNAKTIKAVRGCCAKILRDLERWIKDASSGCGAVGTD